MEENKKIQNDNDLNLKDSVIEDEEMFIIDVNEGNNLKEDNEKDDIYDIEVKLQELYVKLDQLEIKLGTDKYTAEEYNEYYELKEETKALEKEKKQISKKKKAGEKKGILEQISIWIIIYGIIMIILCLPNISYSIWFSFSEVLIDTFSIFDNISMDDGVLYYVWLFILAYAIPLLLHILSWELYINFTKTKVDKWAFRVVWIIQAVLNIAMIVYSIAVTNLFG